MASKGHELFKISAFGDKNVIKVLNDRLIIAADCHMAVLTVKGLICFHLMTKRSARKICKWPVKCENYESFLLCKFPIIRYHINTLMNSRLTFLCDEHSSVS